jgi:hypothetical protein
VDTAEALFFIASQDDSAEITITGVAHQSANYTAIWSLKPSQLLGNYN